MVIGHVDRLHQSRNKFFAIPNRLHARTCQAKDRNLRSIDQGSESGTPNSTQARNRHGTSLHVLTLELSVACLDTHLTQITSQVIDALLVNIPNHRYHQTIGRVHSDTNMEVFLEN